MDKNVKTSQPYQLSEKCYKNNVIFHQSNLQKKKKKKTLKISSMAQMWGNVRSHSEEKCKLL